jgi:hypothetical protein
MKSGSAVPTACLLPPAPWSRFLPLLAWFTTILLKKIVKTIGTELQNDPQFAGEFLVPAKSQGVRRIEDNALIIGIKYIAKPTPKVWMIRREIYQRIRDAFLAADIRIVGREVTVRVDRPDNHGAELGAAAAQAAGARPA